MSVPGVWGSLTLVSEENESGVFSRVMEWLCRTAQRQALGHVSQQSQSSEHTLPGQSA